MKRTWLTICAAIAMTVSVGVASSATAGIMFNEAMINPPGTDQGQEYIELISDTGGNESLDGLSLVMLDGDGAHAGRIDRIFTFAPGFETGSNGLFLFRDTNAVLQPAPDAGTNQFVEPPGNQFFTFGLENGSSTMLLVSGFTGALDDDLDLNDDGTLDAALPWTTVHDVFGWEQNDGSPNDEHSYAAELGGPEIHGPSVGFTPEAFVRLSTDVGFLTVNDLAMTGVGPYTVGSNAVNAAGVPIGFSLGFTMTPGGLNAGSSNPVPEPSTWALLAITGLVGGLQLRRRR